jgi:hypothetical protein
MGVWQWNWPSKNKLIPWIKKPKEWPKLIRKLRWIGMEAEAR